MGTRMGSNVPSHHSKTRTQGVDMEATPEMKPSILIAMCPAFNTEMLGRHERSALIKELHSYKEGLHYFPI